MYIRPWSYADARNGWSGDCVERVGHGDNSCPQRDVGALEVLWISPSVGPFVVAADVGQGRAREIEIL